MIFLVFRVRCALPMSQTLYRKYRPQGFADLTGQNHIKITLQNEIAMGAVSHAYLFTGPRGVGKTTTARIVAKAINCENRKDGESEPCQTCEACISITEGRALDVIEIDAASHTGVDNVRENIIDNARFTPSRLKYKVFIIDEVHMLSTSAWNAMLKTLEEPPAHVIFILATTEAAKIPATITSRCQRFDFHRINAEALVERLSKVAKAEGIEIEQDVLYTIARHADGGLRDAESMLGQLIGVGEKKITAEIASIVLPHSSIVAILEFVDILKRRASADAFRFITKLSEDGVDQRNFIDELVDFLRKLLFTKFTGSLSEFALSFDTTHADRILNYAKIFEVSELMKLLDLMLAAREGVARAKIVQLPLEMAAVEFCEMGRAREISFAAVDEALQKSQPQVGPPLAEKLDEVDLPPLPEEDKPEIEQIEVVKNASLLIKSEAPAESPPRAENVEVALETIAGSWSEFVRRVQSQNHSLPFILGVAKPIALTGNILQVAVQYKFHADRLNEVKNRLILESAAAELFGVKFKIEGVVNEPSALGSESMIKAALEAFGGRVVE